MLKAGPELYIAALEDVVIAEQLARVIDFRSAKLFDVYRVLDRVGTKDDRRRFATRVHEWAWGKFGDTHFLARAPEEFTAKLWDVVASNNVLPPKALTRDGTWLRELVTRAGQTPGEKLLAAYPHLLDPMLRATGDEGRGPRQFVDRGLSSLMHAGHPVDWAQVLAAPGQPTRRVADLATQANAPEMLQWAERMGDELRLGHWGPGGLAALAAWPDPRARALVTRLALREARGGDRSASNLFAQGWFKRAPQVVHDAVVLPLLVPRGGRGFVAALRELDPSRHADEVRNVLVEARTADWAGAVDTRKALVALASRAGIKDGVEYLLALYHAGADRKLVQGALDEVRAHRERLRAFKAWIEDEGQDEVAELMETLKSQDAATRRAAVLALTAMDSRKALPAFVRLSTKDPDAGVRAAALHALEKMAGIAK